MNPKKTGYQTNLNWNVEELAKIEELLDLGDPLWRKKHGDSMSKAVKAYLLDAHRVCVVEAESGVVQ